MDAYPLSWPVAQPRISYSKRSEDRFQVSLRASRDHLIDQLKILGAKSVVINSNMLLRGDGLPYADQREPTDPAVAVYFTRTVASQRPGEKSQERPFVVACDQYRRVLGNLRAIGLTIEAMRTIQRHGSNTLLEQAFTGFAALPVASNGARPWWEVLGVDKRATAAQIRFAYVELSAVHHPDVGGTHERMVEINNAFEAARKDGNSGA